MRMLVVLFCLAIPLFLVASHEAIIKNEHKYPHGFLIGLEEDDAEEAFSDAPSAPIPVAVQPIVKEPFDSKAAEYLITQLRADEPSRPVQVPEFVVKAIPPPSVVKPEVPIVVKPVVKMISRHTADPDVCYEEVEKMISQLQLGEEPVRTIEVPKIAPPPLIVKVPDPVKIPKVVAAKALDASSSSMQEIDSVQREQAAAIAAQEKQVKRNTIALVDSPILSICDEKESKKVLKEAKKDTVKEIKKELVGTDANSTLPGPTETKTTRAPTIVAKVNSNIKPGNIVPFTPAPLPREIRIGEDIPSDNVVLETETKLWQPEPIDHVIRRYAMKLRDDHRLIWNHSKGLQGALVDHLFMSFYFYQARDLYGARELLVTAVERLLEVLNNPTFVPPTGHTPFTANDLEIEIEFQSFMGQYVDRQYVQFVLMRNGIICYQAFDCLESPVMCFTRKERYDQALYIVQIEKEPKIVAATSSLNVQGYNEIEIDMPIDETPAPAKRSIYQNYTNSTDTVRPAVKKAEEKPKSQSQGQPKKTSSKS